MNATVQISHSWVEDVISEVDYDTYLADQSNTARLFVGVCGSNDNVNATFDDSAGTLVGTSCGADPAITGSVRPSAPLSKFNGRATNVDWYLSAGDGAAIIAGTLNQWFLTLTYTTP